MTLTALDIRPIDLRNAQDHEYAALTDFFNIMRLERLPDDPPIGVDERVNNWRHIPERTEITSWAVWDGPRVVAYADAGFERVEENSHLVGFEISVHPDHRRRGLGRELLGHVVEVPRRENRRLMITWTSGRIPAGDALMERLGGNRGLEMRISQLKLDRVDRDMLRRWIEDEPARAAGFEVGFWDGPYPEDRIEGVARLMEVMNTAPRDNLDVEDERVTPERIREWEQQTEASGTQRWVAYAVAPDGRLAGFTAVGWHPNRPHLLDQWGTGVEPDFRGKGLGRWLKAAMLERAMRERPELKFVRTGNAFSNKWMLAINDALGFEYYTSQVAWQVETEKAIESLRAAR